jgi:hypothetical protein
MATKAKPKSNRAKFTLQRKKEVEKPHAKVEKETPAKKVTPIKETKEEREPVREPEIKETAVVEEPIQTTIHTQEPPSEELTSPSLPPTPPQPVAPAQTVITKPEEPQQPPLVHPAEPVNPFSNTTQLTPEPTVEPHNDPFQTSPLMTTPSPQEPLSAQNPLNNPELSPTLPKEEPALAPAPQQHSGFDTPIEVETTGKGKGVLLYFIIVALASFLIGIGSMAALTFGFGKGTLPQIKLPNLPSSSKPSPDLSKSVTIIPSTPTPSKAVDLAAYNIKILNGSGVTGAATKLKTDLTAAGFTVVSAANADSSDFTETIVAYKKDINPDYIKQLKETLGKKYKVGADAQLTSAQTKEADVVITIGSTPAK